jgi:hypothetical protein
VVVLGRALLEDQLPGVRERHAAAVGGIADFEARSGAAVNCFLRAESSGIRLLVQVISGLEFHGHGEPFFALGVGCWFQNFTIESLRSGFGELPVG